jgi:hypothetical protein
MPFKLTPTQIMAIVLAWAFIVIGFLFGWMVKPVKKCPEHKCPEIVAVSDTIITHDTVKTPVYRSEIRYTRDTVHDTIEGKPVTYGENCYLIEDEKQGVTAEICSKEFPSYKPLDLHGSIVVARSPDTQRTIRYVDTVRIPPARKWFAISVGPYIGYGVDKKLNIGAGLTIGIKLKEF